jgi:hypothetical protein
MKSELLKQHSNPLPETVNAGILRKEESKKLELAVISRLKDMGHRFTTKEIAELMSTIDTSKSLWALRENLSKHKNLKNNPDLAKQVLELAKQIQSASVEDLALLRDTVASASKEADTQIRQGTFVFENTALGKRLENSPLGKNPILDIVGIGVGALESLLALLTYILEIALHPVAGLREKMTQKATRSE